MRVAWLCLLPMFAAGWPSLDAPMPTGRDGRTDTALFVGLERYRSLTPNRGARADADRAAAWATQGAGIPGARVRTLHDPNCGEVREALDVLVAQASPSGILWVGWSGYAVPMPDGDLGLLCIDAPADPEALGRTVWPLSDLERRLAASPNKRIVLWLDVDPGAADRQGEALFLEPVPPLTPLAPAPPSVLRWAPSTTPFGEHTLLGQGLLTYAMLAGLRGWADVDLDGRVTIGELADFVPHLLRRSGRTDARVDTPSPGDDRPLLAPVAASFPDLSTARPLRPPMADLDDRFQQTEDRALQLQQQAEAVRSQVQAAADADWARTLARAATSPEEASLAYRLFLDRYASRTYVLDGGEVTITADQVPEARARLARGGASYRPIETVRVAPGEARFGRDPAQDTLPFRTTQPTLVGVREVTRAEWIEVMGSAPGAASPPSDPVTGMSWYDAIAFANERSRIDGLAPAYAVQGRRVLAVVDADGWRLPTEAEWWVYVEGLTLSDACAQANLADLSGAGENTPLEEGGCDDDAPHLTRGGRYAPHRGLFDLVGNVAEWTWDPWSSVPPVTRLDPVAERPDPRRVVVGGSWRTSPAATWRRRGVDALEGAPDVGLRLVRIAPTSSWEVRPDEGLDATVDEADEDAR
jgi:formylglycine-generating enzyme required for sulfatase activity